MYPDQTWAWPTLRFINRLLTLRRGVHVAAQLGLIALVAAALAACGVFQEDRGPGDSDRETLATIYQATNGDGWYINDNWLSNSPIWEWQGVSVDNNGYVTSLVLNSNGLTGEVPKELALLTSLRFLQLDGNQLSGSIPPWLGNLRNLRQLWLNDNQLTGEIPKNFGNLLSLNDLHLHRNQLTGTIPPELGGLVNLRQLHLQQNNLTSEIPPELSRLKLLEELHLEGNQLTGEIPSDLGYSDNLQRMFLNDNRLSGEIPVSLAGLRKLQYLGLSGNTLGGCVPARLRDLVTNFPKLGLPRCSRPQEDALVAFYHATGGPDWKRGNGWLTDAPLNEWEGIKTDDDGKVVSITLDDNNLTGNLPHDVGKLSDLRSLSLGSNMLAGPIPKELGGLLHLETLNLGENQLSGAIPGELGSLRTLRSLNLGGNGLSGAIPEELGRLFALISLNLEKNRLTGPVPPELGRLEDLESFKLSENRLTGEIPRVLVNLGNIESLTLAGNDFNGIMPPNFARHAEAHSYVQAAIKARKAAETPQPPSPTPIPQPDPPDADGDGLIEISNLEQLNAVRHDPDGDGQPTPESHGYAAAFPPSAAVPSCSPCRGYELTRSLDFDDPSSYASGKVNPQWTAGTGWQPIEVLTTTFEGNGHTIRNLYINRIANAVGLFGSLGGPNATVRGLGLVDVDVSGHLWTGALAGGNQGTITGSFATGRVSGKGPVGMLVGENGWQGKIIACYAAGTVEAKGLGGGLAGLGDGAISASYAAVDVSSEGGAGGLIGGLEGRVIASYAVGVVSGDRGSGGLAAYVSTRDWELKHSYSDVVNTGQPMAVGIRKDIPGGTTTAQLRSPTGYTGIYASWNVDLDDADGDSDPATGVDDYWDFGSGADYPALKFDVNGDGTATWQEFGNQRPIPHPTADAAQRRRSTRQYEVLIDVSNLEQLNSIRHDRDGNGIVEYPRAAEAYEAAFPKASVCGNCNGYRLTRSLDFQDPGSYASYAVNKDWTTGEGWSPIGLYSSELYYFRATFEGNGHTINNLYINRERRSQGLFGVVSEAGVIRNISLSKVSVRGKDNTGALVGLNLGTISSSHSSGAVSGLERVGGLVGSSRYAELTDSYSTCQVTGGDMVGGLVGSSVVNAIVHSSAGGDVQGERHVGGLVGFQGQGPIIDSHAAGDVSGTESAGGLVGGLGIVGAVRGSSATGNVYGGSLVGGLVGSTYRPYGQPPGHIDRSFATGDVSGDGDAIGGLVGDNFFLLTHSYATGSVTGGDNSVGLGGLAGRNLEKITRSYATGNVTGGQKSSNLGGLADSNSGHIIASYATGGVSGEKWVGGLVGHASGSIAGAYATGDVSGREDVGGLAGTATGSATASYSTGGVAGESNVGGLFGSAYSFNCRGCYWDLGTSGQVEGVGKGTSEGSEGMTTARLTAPTGYQRIYRDWNEDLDNADEDDNPTTGRDDFWEFGASRDYPKLKADLDGDGAATSTEFGSQHSQG